MLDARAPHLPLRALRALADLYAPLNMPTILDRAVDKCYRSEPFPSDRARVEHLFALYEKLTAPLVVTKTLRRRA